MAGILSKTTNPWTAYNLNPSHIDHLPPECLAIILSHIPLENKLKLRCVSKKWMESVDYICSRVTSLKLFRSNRNLLEYCQILVDSALSEAYPDFALSSRDDERAIEIVGGIDGSTTNCHFLPELFPNVTKLTIDYDNLVDIDVPYLLYAWRDLTSFTLRHTTWTPNLSRTVTAINSLSHLQSLALIHNNRNIDSRLIHWKPTPMEKLTISILSQVKQFFIIGYNLPSDKERRLDDGHPLDIMRQLGSNLTHLVVGDMNISISEWREFFETKFDMAISLRHLKLFDMKLSIAWIEDFFRLVADYMGSLTALDVTQWNGRSQNSSFLLPKTVLNPLRRLGNLTQLGLPHALNIVPPDMVQTGHALSFILGQFQDQERQFSRVVKLQIRTDMNRNGSFYQIYSHLFPSVEKLVIYTTNRHTRSDTAAELANLKRRFTKIRSLKFWCTDVMQSPLKFLGQHVELYNQHQAGGRVGSTFSEPEEARIRVLFQMREEMLADEEEQQRARVLELRLLRAPFLDRLVGRNAIEE